jgi:hypothetical protein
MGSSSASLGPASQLESTRDLPKCSRKDAVRLTHMHPYGAPLRPKKWQLIVDFATKPLTCHLRGRRFEPKGQKIQTRRERTVAPSVGDWFGRWLADRREGADGMGTLPGFTTMPRLGSSQ